jgi:hypothetical protein
MRAMTARLATLAALVAATFSVLAPVARSAPLTLARGDVSAPAVAFAPNGDGLFVWSDAAGVTFCRIPAGATACAVTTAIAPAGTNAKVFADAAGNPVVFVNCAGCGETRYASTDGGATFAAGEVAGTLSGAGLGSAFDPAVGVLYAMTDAARFQRMPAAGAPEAQLAEGAASGASVAYADRNGTRTLIAAYNQGRRLRYRTTTAAEPDAAAAWTPARTVVGSGPAVSPLVTGPGGFSVLTEEDCPDHCYIVIRHPPQAQEAASIVAQPFTDDHVTNIDLTADAAGSRLHMVAREPNYGELSYATSTDGDRFTRSQRLTVEDAVAGAQVAGGARAGQGWVVWVAGADAADRRIRARELPAPRDTSDDGHGRAKPLKHPGLKVIDARGVKGTVFFLYGPKRCVPPSEGEARLRLDVRQRPAGKQFLAESVDFGPGAFDDSAPFTATVPFDRRDARSGSVGYFVVVNRANEGRTRTVKLKGSVDTCV